jgi:hypothetical protein
MLIFENKLEIIEKTATFVAKSKDLEKKILEREQHNPLFEFLRPTHSLHAFYRGKVREKRRDLGILFLCLWLCLCFLVLHFFFVFGFGFESWIIDNYFCCFNFTSKIGIKDEDDPIPSGPMGMTQRAVIIEGTVAVEEKAKRGPSHLAAYIVGFLRQNKGKFFFYSVLTLSGFGFNCV